MVPVLSRVNYQTSNGLVLTGVVDWPEKQMDETQTLWSRYGALAADLLLEWDRIQENQLESGM